MGRIDKMKPELAEAQPRAARLWRSIADALEQDILEGRFAAGSALPTVLDLADRFDVNRHTVRQALQSLQARGLISVEQGRGTFVRQRAFDYRLGERVRFGDNFAGERDTDNVLIGKMTIEAALEKDARRLAVATGTPLWTFRTLRHVGGAPFSTSFHRVAQARFPDFDRMFKAHGQAFSRTMSACGAGDYRRLSTRVSAVLPTAEEQELLAVQHNEPILLSRAIDGLASDQPIHLVSTAFVGSRIEFVFEPGSA